MQHKSSKLLVRMFLGSRGKNKIKYFTLAVTGDLGAYRWAQVPLRAHGKQKRTIRVTGGN
jgi:hypothetical protein